MSLDLAWSQREKTLTSLESGKFPWVKFCLARRSVEFISYVLDSHRYTMNIITITTLSHSVVEKDVHCVHYTYFNRYCNNDLKGFTNWVKYRFFYSKFESTCTGSTVVSRPSESSRKNESTPSTNIHVAKTSHNSKKSTRKAMYRLFRLSGERV